MTTEEHEEAQGLKAQWSATVLSRLLPLLVHRELMSQDSLDFAVSELEARKANAPEAARAIFDDEIDRLKAPFGSGHYG